MVHSLLFSLWLSAAVPQNVGWFYTSSAKLAYPGAHSHMIDGPYRTRVDCEAARSETIELSKMFPMTLEIQPCHERKSA